MSRKYRAPTYHRLHTYTHSIGFLIFKSALVVGGHCHCPGGAQAGWGAPRGTVDTQVEHRPLSPLLVLSRVGNSVFLSAGCSAWSYTCQRGHEGGFQEHAFFLLNWMKNRSGLYNSLTGAEELAVSAKAVKVRYITLEEQANKMVKLISLSYRSEN